MNLYPGLKLGKLPPRSDPRTLRLAKYMRDLAPAPPKCDWLSGITDWGMMRNDTLGDCTCAGVGHFLQVISAATGPIYTPSDAEVVNLYKASCGYVEGDSATDNGGVEVDVLNYVRRNGFAGQQLLAYADPDPGNYEHIRQAIYHFGGVYIGVELPITAQTQTVWDVVGNPSRDSNSRPGSWGGHCVFVPYYGDTSDGLIGISWKRQIRMTWPFWQTYCSESHALLAKMWLDRAPSDFHLSGNLQADLEEVVN